MDNSAYESPTTAGTAAYPGSTLKDCAENIPLTAKNFYKVTITKADNGFIVSVGCKTLVATTWEEVAKGLDLYYKNPHEAENKYCK